MQLFKCSAVSDELCIDDVSASTVATPDSPKQVESKSGFNYNDIHFRIGYCADGTKFQKFVSLRFSLNIEEIIAALSLLSLSCNRLVMRHSCQSSYLSKAPLARMSTLALGKCVSKPFTSCIFHDFSFPLKLSIMPVILLIALFLHQRLVFNSFILIIIYTIKARSGNHQESCCRQIISVLKRLHSC